SCELYCLYSFYNPATTDIYTLSLHDALPIYSVKKILQKVRNPEKVIGIGVAMHGVVDFETGTSLVAPILQLKNIPIKEELERARSEEHTSELQSRENLVCRLLLEKKKTNKDK